MALWLVRNRDAASSGNFGRCAHGERALGRGQHGRWSWSWSSAYSPALPSIDHAQDEGEREGCVRRGAVHCKRAGSGFTTAAAGLPGARSSTGTAMSPFSPTILKRSRRRVGAVGPRLAIRSAALQSHQHTNTPLSTSAITVDLCDCWRFSSTAPALCTIKGQQHLPSGFRNAA